MQKVPYREIRQLNTGAVQNTLLTIRTEGNYSEDPPDSLQLLPGGPMKERIVI